MYMKPLPLLDGTQAQALPLKWLSLHHQGCLGAFPSNRRFIIYSFTASIYKSARTLQEAPVGPGSSGNEAWLTPLHRSHTAAAWGDGEGVPTSEDRGC